MLTCQLKILNPSETCITPEDCFCQDVSDPILSSHLNDMKHMSTAVHSSRKNRQTLDNSKRVFLSATFLFLSGQVLLIFIYLSVRYTWKCYLSIMLHYIHKHKFCKDSNKHESEPIFNVANYCKLSNISMKFSWHSTLYISKFHKNPIWYNRTKGSTDISQYSDNILNHNSGQSLIKHIANLSDRNTFCNIV